MKKAMKALFILLLIVSANDDRFAEMFPEQSRINL